MWKIIDADAFYQQEWVHCGMYEPMVGVKNIKGGRETLKNGVLVQLRINTPFFLYKLNIVWIYIARYID